MIHISRKLSYDRSHLTELLLSALTLQQLLRFVGGPLGSGKQWWPWIHVDDVVSSILFAIDHDDFETYRIGRNAKFRI